ncbi:hypothetical protein E4U43_002555 [Claviceps pusilla]|uniref:Uncharacterized protein n=1 Tax=Claviceps pusilla TaxID=123648 RepID=A0A9P7N6H9_9HYPO|nr:hypothetical protein E4U43_002555 [Claviceps pusilla]
MKKERSSPGGGRGIVVLARLENEHERAAPEAVRLLPRLSGKSNVWHDMDSQSLAVEGPEDVAS